MDGFKVTMTDLRAAADQFRAQASTLSGALPGSGPAPAPPYATASRHASFTRPAA